jgi:hypothetical protein
MSLDYDDPFVVRQLQESLDRILDDPFLLLDEEWDDDEYAEEVYDDHSESPDRY